MKLAAGLLLERDLAMEFFLTFRTSGVGIHLLLWSLTTVCQVCLSCWKGKVQMVSVDCEAFNWGLGGLLILQML